MIFFIFWLLFLSPMRHTGWCKKFLLHSIRGSFVLADYLCNGIPTWLVDRSRENGNMPTFVRTYNPVLVHHDESRSKDPILSPQDLHFTLLFLFYCLWRPQDVFPDMLFMDGPTIQFLGPDSWRHFRAFPCHIAFNASPSVSCNMKETRRFPLECVREGEKLENMASLLSLLTVIFWSSISNNNLRLRKDLSIERRDDVKYQWSTHPPAQRRCVCPMWQSSPLRVWWPSEKLNNFPHHSR